MFTHFFCKRNSSCNNPCHLKLLHSSLLGKLQSLEERLQTPSNNRQKNEYKYLTTFIGL